MARTDSRKKKRRVASGRTAARRTSTRRTAWRWFAPLALLLVVSGVGALVWSRSAGGRAALLQLGAVKLYPEVQQAVGAALAAALPGYISGPALLVSDRDKAAYDWPLPRIGPGAAIRCRLVAVPAQQNFWEIQHTVAAAVAPAGGRVLWGERIASDSGDPGGTVAEPASEILRLDIGVTASPTHTLLLYHAGGDPPEIGWGAGGASSLWAQLNADSAAATIALILDDWGHFQSELTRELLALPIPLTLAVLPGEPYSRHFALEATELALPGGQQRTERSEHGSGSRALRQALGCPVEWHLVGHDTPLLPKRREVMLHLPMEPLGYPGVNPGPDPLTVGMGPRDIADLVDRALTALPTVRGVNNHMGSRATADEATMQALMAVLAERGLYFVDSLTTAESVGYEVALRAGLPAARNRIFLDVDYDSVAEVRKNLNQLVQTARTQGFAVGIGHPHAETLQVLRAETPRLIAAGVRFVTVSEWLALRRVARQDG